METKIKNAIKKHGKQNCIDAYKKADAGDGSRTIAYDYEVTTRQCDAMINAGRFIITGIIY